jgi:hypothetical protein
VHWRDVPLRCCLPLVSCNVLRSSSRSHAFNASSLDIVSCCCHVLQYVRYYNLAYNALINPEVYIDRCGDIEPNKSKNENDTSSRQLQLQHRLPYRRLLSLSPLLLLLGLHRAARSASYISSFVTLHGLFSIKQWRRLARSAAAAQAATSHRSFPGQSHACKSDRRG